MMTLVELEGYSQKKVENNDWLIDKEEDEKPGQNSTELVSFKLFIDF